MSNPNDWSQFYNNNQNLFTTTTTVSTTTSTTGDSRLSPETGRVSKPARRRTRASRRTPTTLLNTDTTNFKAMVQQFTGGPNAMAFGSSPPGPSFTLTPPSSNLALGGSGCLNAPPVWQYTFQQQVANAPLQPQPQTQTRPYMLSNMNPNDMGVIGGVNANQAILGGFQSAEEDVNGGGGGGAAPPSSRNVNSSAWLQ